MIDKKQIIEKYFLDTNILIYLLNSNDLEKHKTALDFIKNNPNGCISIQNLKELSNVLLMKTSGTIDEITESVLRIGNEFTMLLELPQDTITTINLCNNRNNFYDALLIATMKRHGLTTIITENTKDFDYFDGIRAINPFK